MGRFTGPEDKLDSQKEEYEQAKSYSAYALHEDESEFRVDLGNFDIKILKAVLSKSFYLQNSLLVQKLAQGYKAQPNQPLKDTDSPMEVDEITKLGPDVTFMGVGLLQLEGDVTAPNLDLPVENDFAVTQPLQNVQTESTMAQQKNEASTMEQKLFVEINTWPKDDEPEPEYNIKRDKNPYIGNLLALGHIALDEKKLGFMLRLNFTPEPQKPRESNRQFKSRSGGFVARTGTSITSTLFKGLLMDPSRKANTCQKIHWVFGSLCSNYWQRIDFHNLKNKHKNFSFEAAVRDKLVAKPESSWCNSDELGLKSDKAATKYKDLPLTNTTYEIRLVHNRSQLEYLIQLIADLALSRFILIAIDTESPMYSGLEGAPIMICTIQLIINDIAYVVDIQQLMIQHKLLAQLVDLMTNCSNVQLIAQDAKDGTDLAKMASGLFTTAAKFKENLPFLPAEPLNLAKNLTGKGNYTRKIQNIVNNVRTKRCSCQSKSDCPNSIEGIPADSSVVELVATLFGQRSPKAQQKSDFSQRPLTDAQLRYAADDAYFLWLALKKCEERIKHCGDERTIEEYVRSQ